jgi:hypothetical protein
MSDGENPVLSYFATSHDSVSWLGGSETSEHRDPFAQDPEDQQFASDGIVSYATAHSQFDQENILSRAASVGEDSASFAPVETGFYIGIGDQENEHSGPIAQTAQAATSEPNPFLQSPSEPTLDDAYGETASGIDAYFGNAADNWLGDNVSQNNWLAGSEQEGNEPPVIVLPAPPPVSGPVQPVFPVAKPALYSVPALKAVIGQSVQPRNQLPPPVIPAKLEGFVSPSKFFPPSPIPSHTSPFRQSSYDDPAVRKNFPEGRCSGATWAWGGKLFVFASEDGMQRTHAVSLHLCGKRSAFQAAVSRIKAWPGCDASSDAIAKFVNDLKSFKIDDQAVELVPPMDSFELLTSLLSLLLSRGYSASPQQYQGDLLNLFDDSNSFSDTMNLVSNIDAFRPNDPTRDLAQVQQHLLEGKFDNAIEHAIQSDLWAEAIILSQATSSSSLVRSVTQRLTTRCLIEGTPLWFLHALSCGIAPAGLKLHSHWRLCAKILLRNRFDNAWEGLRALARAVLSHGDTCAWIVLNATAAVFSKDKSLIAAANFATPPAADIADLRNAMKSIAFIQALKAKDSSLLTDQDKRLVAMERDILSKFDELKGRAPCKEMQQGSLFFGFPSDSSPALMHPTTCERAEMFAAAFAGKAKGHMVRGVLYWRFMHAMWMVWSLSIFFHFKLISHYYQADHGLRSEAIALFQSVQKRGTEVDYETGKWLSRCAELAVARLEQGRVPSAPASSSSGSLFGGIGSFVDSTVKFLVTGAESPAAPAKANPAPDRAPAAHQGNAVPSSGPKVVFFNPHAGRSQIAQQLHQQPAQTQQKLVATSAAADNDQSAFDPVAPPSSPPPKIDRSNSDPIKLDSSKNASPPPGDKHKGKGGWGIGSFIGGIVSKVLPVSKGVEVDLGEESTMYYNEKLGRYVERGKEDEAAASASVAPPPVVAAWSDQPTAALTMGSQPALSQEKSNSQDGVGFNAVQAPAINASSLPSTATGPPMPSAAAGPPMPMGSARFNAPPSSSALGKSRCSSSRRIIVHLNIRICHCLFSTFKFSTC